MAPLKGKVFLSGRDEKKSWYIGGCERDRIRESSRGKRGCGYLEYGVEAQKENIEKMHKESLAHTGLFRCLKLHLFGVL